MTASFDTIFCDDIRVENNGKLILVGVYGTDIILGLPENPIPLAIWVRFFGLSPGTHKNTISFKFNGELVADFSGEIIATEDSIPQAWLNGVVFNFNEEGTLQSTVTFEDGTEIVANPISVKFADRVFGKE
jgi:hypothetical protein